MIQRMSIFAITAFFITAFFVAGSIHGDSPAAKLVEQQDAWFRSPEGRKTMECILSWQADHGDWPKNKDTTQEMFSDDRSKLKGTFDNGATVGELRFLGRAFRVTGDMRCHDAFLAGFDHIIKAQYPNGGWPQYFPLSKDYHRHITFNDDSMLHLLELVRDCASSPDFDFLDRDRRSAAREAFDLGIDCIVKCQVVVNGTPTAWCAQHDEVTLAPANARSYELASLSGAESAGILKLLMTIENPSADLVRCVKGGVEWYEAVKISGFRYQRSSDEPSLVADASARTLWSRFYELESNRPFFCDRDGVVKYDIEEIGHERRSGYTWYGNWGESLFNAYQKWPHH
jgi:PelA/Pel-15E family pectate lyase